MAIKRLVVSIVPSPKSIMKPLVTRLEFWSSGLMILDQCVIVPAGYSIPRVGEMIVLPNDPAPSKWRCDAVVHQFNYAEETRMECESCILFVVRILVSKV